MPPISYLTRTCGHPRLFDCFSTNSKHIVEPWAPVESNESDQGSKVGKPVAASELGLNSLDWEESQELEAFLSYSFDIKDTIEKRGFCTGAHVQQRRLMVRSGEQEV